MTTNEDFWLWVEREMAARDLSFYQLERDAGVGNATISRPAREWREPTLMVCQAIARGFDISPEDVLRRAGILPPTQTDAGIDARAAYLIHQLRELLAMLPPDQQERIMSTTILMAEALATAAEATEQAKKAQDRNQELSRK